MSHASSGASAGAGTVEADGQPSHGGSGQQPPDGALQIAKKGKKQLTDPQPKHVETVEELLGSQLPSTAPPAQPGGAQAAGGSGSGDP